jgi:hypothetical protein
LSWHASAHRSATTHRRRGAAASKAAEDWSEKIHLLLHLRHLHLAHLALLIGVTQGLRLKQAAKGSLAEALGLTGWACRGKQA